MFWCLFSGVIFDVLAFPAHSAALKNPVSVLLSSNCILVCVTSLQVCLEVVHTFISLVVLLYFRFLVLGKDQTWVRLLANLWLTASYGHLPSVSLWRSLGRVTNMGEAQPRFKSGSSSALLRLAINYKMNWAVPFRT